ncbi:hypothetical protein D7V80_38060 [Corallococcus sp. CA054B]|uniref:SitI6 family double-CXXCG motif immunity protein n=1 Tax=Corallococcus sp. CA054B TaxID=2316734 RepID=UPI000EA0B677|nr:double-CXXCG motif protein [Corallococcus sp. CA054B]RKG58516.1 hypothetical protein D7V80_38060 [Corallococcus sp. CA054B]
MRYYEVRASQGPWRWTGRYEAEHRWMLPGVDCPHCGTWADTGAYPTVDLSGTGALAEELEGALWPRSIAEYRRMAAAVAPLLAADQELAPGGEFGPLRGTASGDFGPLTAWPGWQLLVREDARAALHGPQLQGLHVVPAELQGSAGQLYEVEARPVGHAHHDSVMPSSPSCDVCGHQGGFDLANDWALDAASLPSADVFRIRGTGVLVVSERFAAPLDKLGPSDIELREVPQR